MKRTKTLTCLQLIVCCAHTSAHQAKQGHPPVWSIGSGIRDPGSFPKLHIFAAVHSCLNLFHSLKALTLSHLAVGQNQCYHFGVGEFTTHFRTYFSGWIGMFTGLRALDFDPWPSARGPLGTKRNARGPEAWAFPGGITTSLRSEGAGIIEPRRFGSPGRALHQQASRQKGDSAWSSFHVLNLPGNGRQASSKWQLRGVVRLRGAHVATCPKLPSAANLKPFV